MRVLISGAGIGGLTAALCALHHGHEVVVLERAEALGEVGAGIQLPPNAMKVFRALGLTEALLDMSVRPDAIQTRMGVSGREIFHIPLATQSEARWGEPYLHIHRADYIRVLAQALHDRAPHALHLGAEVARFSQIDQAVMAHLTEGAAIEGDVLIGADGIHSNIRTQIFDTHEGQLTGQFTGNVAWRVLVPRDRLGRDAPPRTACAWMGRGRHAVTYHLRESELINFVGVVERDDWEEEGWTVPGSKAEAVADFENWHPMIAKLIAAADEDSFYRWGLFDHPPLPHWTQGRVALLGDAAHPMLPFLAQGAAMAVEDAWVLAASLKDNPTVDLQNYAKARQPRTANVQAASRANQDIFHRRTRLSQLMTYAPMWLAGRIMPNIVHRRMDWLYGHNVVT